ncbi:hypothetical protein UO65_2531 [Actinokineospora spheciospongiae]|uniref:Lipoprotein LpqE n=1 Tax=Actinokineospora spheciospongiae TaxID=909613 RepID=W7IMR5_9PSEU|nr:hypothetical protein [Actinokineospora spheciospongiae]EWC62165.1 hypothetical protein UO65_2531 [Actinokineospora spheciospongiae]PWW65843.1 hypothetical protein DFQ13_102601 [Actinokineospora spheciospongiae]
MSRGQQNLTGGRRLAPALAGLGLAAVLGVTGCSAGQITQTDSQLPAVNGAEHTQGAIALRNAVLAYPEGGSYPEGSEAPLVLTIVNTGSADDALTEVTSPVAASATVTGSKDLPGGFAIEVGTPGENAEVGGHSSAAPTPTPSGAPSSAPGSVAPTTSAKAPNEKLGELEIVLEDINTRLFPGKTVPVTFVFANAGPVTVELPIGASSEPREEQHAEEH